MGIFLNQLKTTLLLAGLTALLLFVGNILGGYSGLFIGIIIALALNFGSYWFSDKIVLRMYKAKEVKQKDQPTLFKMVKDLAYKANLPMPKVYIVPTAQPNAFATGRNPKHAAVACTFGILKTLSHEELKGVLAHEMAHIKNRDTLIQTVTATIAGVISYVAMMARWAAIFGGFGGNSRDGDNIVGLIVLGILTPIIAMIIQLAISRSREYIADETGAKLIKNPLPLANALEKLEISAKEMPLRNGNKATSSLFIVNPFSRQSFINLFSTHPSTKERVKKLKGLKL